VGWGGVKGGEGGGRRHMVIQGAQQPKCHTDEPADNANAAVDMWLVLTHLHMFTAVLELSMVSLM
jgi:hypothetical protein